MFILASCKKDDDNGTTMPEPTSKTITQLASADPQFSILVQALTKANLANTLNSAGNYTVFAPTN